MNTRTIKAGTIDVSVVIRIVDSTDGTPETGVVFNTAGIDLQYRRELAASTAITEATLAALTTAHADGGFLHIGNGYYRLDLPDAACAAGATGVLVHGIVTGMVVIGCYIELIAYDPQSATNLGLSQIDAATSSRMATYTQPTGFLAATFPTGTVANTTNITAGTITTVTNLTNLPTIPANWITAAGITAAALNGKGDWNIGKTGYSLLSTGLDAIVSTSTGMVEIAKAIWDRVLSGATHNVATSAGRRLRALNDFGQYEGGLVWIDTVNGTAGTVNFENGTVNNPVASIADAITIANSIGLRGFRILPESSITFAATMNGFTFRGHNYTLAFGGQSIANTFIEGATVSGTYTGTTAILDNCIINAVTGPGMTLRSCYFNEVTITNNGTAGWFMNDCRSRIAGTGRVTFDFGAAVGNTGLSLRAYSGGIELQNMGQLGTDNASCEGFGNLIINANCIGGTVAKRGIWDFTNNGSGQTIIESEMIEELGFILTDTAEIGAAGAGLTNITLNAASIDLVWDEPTVGHATAGTTGKALTDAGSAGDPWSTALPGAYGAGTAGKIVGDNINAPIATVDTVVDAIKAKTDSLTFTKAGEVDSNLQSVNDVTVNGDGAGTPMGV